MGTMASLITSLTSAYSTVHLPVSGEFSAQMGSNGKIFPLDDVIMDRN